MPDFVDASNPLDLTAQAITHPEMYERTIKPFLADDTYGSLLLAVTELHGRGRLAERGQVIVDLIRHLFGLIAVIAHRSEHTEPERQCPTCNKVVKLYVQVCPRCGTDLYLPDPSEVRMPQG